MVQERKETTETVSANDVTVLPSHQLTTTRCTCSEVNPTGASKHQIDSHTKLGQGTMTKCTTVPHACSVSNINNKKNMASGTSSVNNKLAIVVDSTAESCADENKKDGLIVTVGETGRDVEGSEGSAFISTATVTTTEISCEEVTNNKEGKESPADDSDEALDGGWGYVVILGAFIVMNSVGIITTCYSIIFLTFLTDLDTSSTMVATVFNGETFMWSSANLLAGPLTEVFGWRKVAFFGGLLTSVGIGASTFATSASFLLFSHSLLTGLGDGMSCFVSFAIMPHYFKRLRGRANALMSAGICFGGILWPPIITFLQGEYGHKGTTLILAAFMLNNCVAAMVFHPVRWHKKTGSSDTVGTLNGVTKCVNEEDNDSPPERRYLKGAVECVKLDMDDKANGCAGPCKTNAVRGTDGSSLIVNNLTRETGKERGHVTKNDEEVEEEEENLRPCVLTEISSLQTTTMKSQTVTRDAQQNEPGLWQALQVMVGVLVRNVGILRLSSALIICIGGSCIVCSYMNFSMLVPFAMESRGYTQEEVSWVLSISQIANLVARLVVSSLADFPGFQVRWMYMAGAAIIVIGAVGFNFVERLVWVGVMMGVWGFGVGTCMSMFNLLMIICMGVKKYPAILGVSGFFIGLVLLSSGPFFGMIRDVSDSYTLTICCLHSLTVISIIVTLFLPRAVAYDARKEQQQ
ncbi:hypothetical protein Pcinc_030089 [Petrolisthes cinctipes]|uniref:Uncharacterized protein n=1 Tax=Petrolisthes cinctipes TaxID=88211 RepID=A0AAE1K6U0_PETCI|nr:hypothetical protein Pcinc_030089 [Petrolisthes cinctipes]